jgi:hypothetical protein
MKQLTEGGQQMAKVVCLGIQIVDILGRPVTEIPQGQNVALLDEIRLYHGTLHGVGS